MEKHTFGTRLRLARLRAGYTQQMLAEKAGIGNVYLGEIERGIKIPSLPIFSRLVDILQVSADSILREDPLPAGELSEDALLTRLNQLTPRQRKTALDILNAYLSGLDT